MASSFIKFKEYGFWARDGFVEAILLLLFEEMEVQHNSNIEWLNHFKTDLARESLPLICGGMSMRLDEHLVNQERENLILSMLTNIKSKIISSDRFLSGAHLNQLKKKVREHLVATGMYSWSNIEIEEQVNADLFGANLPKEDCFHGFDLLSKLISGKIKYTSATPITYW